MAYKALYRAFRPKRFSEVLGQEHITTILKNQIGSGRTSHAYVFSGSRGTGKTTTARILARAVNCTSPVDGEPCGECEACLRTAGETADIIEMDAASNTGVDDVRAIIDKARFTPLELGMKVYIIDEAHELSDKAFNALLKTLEEPPAHVIFILATTETRKIPATILSRCQRFDFHRISVEDIVKCVSAAAEGVGASIEREGLLAIARASEGGMRDALTLAEQCIAFCGDEVSAADVVSVLGGTDGDYLFGMADALISGDRAGALRALGSVVDSGRDLNVFAQDIARHFRALLLTKLCGSCADMLGCTEDAMRRYQEQASRASEGALLRATELIMSASANMRYMALPRAQMECALVRITSPEEEREQNSELLIERIDKLEAKLASAQFQPAPRAAAKEAAATVAAPEAAAPKAAPAAEREAAPAKSLPNDGEAVWKAARENMGGNPTLAVLARRATSARLDGDILIVSFSKKNMCDAFEKSSEAHAALESARPGTKLRCIVEGADTLEERAKQAFGDGIEIIDS